MVCLPQLASRSIIAYPTADQTSAFLPDLISLRFWFLMSGCVCIMIHLYRYKNRPEKRLQARLADLSCLEKSLDLSLDAAESVAASSGSPVCRVYSTDSAAHWTLTNNAAKLLCLGTLLLCRQEVADVLSCCDD